MPRRNPEPGTGRGKFTFTDIYRAIESGDDFNAPQLFYLSRLLARKLRRLDPRLDFRDLGMKPYEQ